jgi:FixJ family two-component response regulator
LQQYPRIVFKKLGLMKFIHDDRDAGLVALRGRCVLVVEDGWQVADALLLLLQTMGMAVAGPVATANEARALAMERRPDVAIVDVNLSGEMAYGLLDWLGNRGIPIIVISGYEDLPASLQRFSAILHKPFTAAALRTALKVAVARTL